jgi:hypothetical protein
MFTSKVLSALRMLLQNTMWTDLSTSLRTMLTLTPLLSSSEQKSVYNLSERPNLVLILSSQARGEAVVRSIFPETTIVRPAPLFGFEDRLLHKLAGVTNVLTSNHMQERYWPVHVRLILFLEESFKLIYTGNRRW